MKRTLWTLVFLVGFWLSACEMSPAPIVDGNASLTKANDSVVGEHLSDKPSLKVSQVAPAGVVQNRKVVAITASGEETESAEQVPVDRQSRGNVELEPEIWDPNAFTRPRRRMTIEQLDRAILTATGGIGWIANDWDGYSMWAELGPTLGVPDYFRRVRTDLTPSMTFQKFLGDGANVICSNLIIHEQNINPEERVFFVHISPGINPVNDAAATDANIQMLLLRFHGKSVALDSPHIEPWRNLVNTIAANSGPWFGDWLEAWTGMCIALLKHPDFYSY